jgi:hypothetical protein
VFLCILVTVTPYTITIEVGNTCYVNTRAQMKVHVMILLVHSLISIISNLNM